LESETRKTRNRAGHCHGQGDRGLILHFSDAKTLLPSIRSQKFVDLDLFSQVRKIELDLASHSCAEALLWCNENKTALRKTKVRFSIVKSSVLRSHSNQQSTLEFELRMQEFIELARARKIHEAIAYAGKHLSSWQETHFSEIRQAMALIAFPPTTMCGPYKVLVLIKQVVCVF
jgi:macrophage erythroblast attacher